MEKDVKCPQCGGAMAARGADSPELVGRSSSTSGVNLNAAAKHADDIQRKNEEHGLLYKCLTCGYYTRVKPDAPPAEAEEPADAEEKPGRRKRDARA